MSSTRFPLLFVLLPILLFCACGNDDDDSNECIESSMTYTVSENKSIEIDTAINNVFLGDTVVSVNEYLVRDGQDMLFKYASILQLCDSDIADGSASLTFSMLVPKNSASTFYYTDDQILSISAFVDIFNAPDSKVHQFVQEGEIFGTRIDDNSWQVSIDIVTSLQFIAEFEGDRPTEISIDEIFTLEQ